MNRKVYKLFKPLFVALKNRDYNEPIIKMDKLLHSSGEEEFFLEIYFEGDVGGTIESSTPYPEDFQMLEGNFFDDKLEFDYQVRLRKLYSSDDVFESEIATDINELVKWSNRLELSILA